MKTRPEVYVLQGAFAIELYFVLIARTTPCSDKSSLLVQSLRQREGGCLFCSYLYLLGFDEAFFSFSASETLKDCVSQ